MYHRTNHLFKLVHILLTKENTFCSVFLLNPGESTASFYHKGKLQSLASYGKWLNIKQWNPPKRCQKEKLVWPSS